MFVSTNVNSVVAARQRHDLIRAEPLARTPAQGLEAAAGPACTGLDENDARGSARSTSPSKERMVGRRGRAIIAFKASESPV
jgi:hypothetical protein